MKKLVVLFLLFLMFASCDSVENTQSNIRPMPTTKIQKIEISNKVVKVTISVGTPDPCWDYYRTDRKQLINDYTAKIYAQPDDNGACPDVLWFFTREEIIYFLTSGEKSIKFWQNDSTYIDTTIIL